MAKETGWDFDDDDDDVQGNQQTQNDKDSKGLRSYLKKMETQNKELAKELEELKLKDMTSKVNDAVKAKGYDPMVAELVPTEVAKDSAALDKWLSDREKLFGKAKQDQEQLVPQGFPEDIVDDPDADAWGRISRVANNALPASADANTRADLMSVKSRDELDALMRKHGNSWIG